MAADTRRGSRNEAVDDGFLNRQIDCDRNPNYSVFSHLCLPRKMLGAD